MSGTPSRLLSAVLHLCLAKKLPAWVVRNNRPVMQEPYLRRLETGVVQDRRVTRREPRRAVPPEHFAYRRQLSGQTLALSCRWLLTYSAIRHAEIWSDDWDEANAFCNPDREVSGGVGSRGPGGIFVALAPALLPRARRMGGLPIRAGGPVQAEPREPRATARVWGTSPRSRRSGRSTSATRSARGSTPRTGDPGRRTRRPTSRGSPRPPHGFLPEVAFSDDRRHFALSGWGLAWLLGICAVTCAAACGSVQVGKLKVYRLVLRHRRLHYASGTLPTTLGLL